MSPKLVHITPQQPEPVASLYNQWVLSIPRRLDVVRKSTIENSLKLRTDLLLELDGWKGFKSQGDYKLVEDQVREALGIVSLERWRLMRRLRSSEDIRRALRWQPVLPVKRFADEMVYPSTGWFGRYLNLHGNMEVPLAWHFWAAVSLFGLACRRNFVIDRGNYYVWPNHYVVLVGPTTERKTTAVDQALAIFYRYQAQLESDCASKSPPLNKSIALHYGRGTPQPWFEEFKVTDEIRTDPLGVTYQAGRNESIGYIVNDEVVNLIGKNEAGSETWIRVLTGLYTPRTRWADKTMTRGKNEFRNTAVSCLFASTASWLRESCTPASFDGGWMGRCVYVPRPTSRREYAWPPPVDPVAAEQLAQELVEISLAPEQEMGLPTEVRDWFTEWYHQEKTAQGQSRDTTLLGWAGRKQDHMWKLAITLALSHGRTSLTIADMAAARNILDEEEKWLPECFAELSASPQSQLHDTVYEKLMGKGGGSMTRRELYRAVRGLGLTSKALDEVLYVLKQEGRIEQGTVGRTREILYKTTPPEPTVVKKTVIDLG